MIRSCSYAGLRTLAGGLARVQATGMLHVPMYRMLYAEAVGGTADRNGLGNFSSTTHALNRGRLRYLSKHPTKTVVKKKSVGEWEARIIRARLRHQDAASRVCVFSGLQEGRTRPSPETRVSEAWNNAPFSLRSKRRTESQLPDQIVTRWGGRQVDDLRWIDTFMSCGLWARAIAGPGIIIIMMWWSSKALVAISAFLALVMNHFLQHSTRSFTDILSRVEYLAAYRQVLNFRSCASTSSTKSSLPVRGQTRKRLDWARSGRGAPADVRD
nr:hypothetical protein CFP56_20468 [Quercus suber]